MTRTLAWCLTSLMLLCGLPSVAAAQARADFSVGYNALFLVGQNGESELTLPAGFYVDLAGRLERGVMLVGEVADSTRSTSGGGTASVLTYAGGLRFVSTERYGYGRRDAARPFVEVLIGGGRLSASLAGETVVSGDVLTVMPGAGLDMPISRHAALRLAGHYDWFHSGNSSSGALRLDIGVSFRTGRR